MFPAPASTRRRASSDNPSRLQMALREGFNYVSREHSQRVRFSRWCQQQRCSQADSLVFSVPFAPAQNPGKVQTREKLRPAASQWPTEPQGAQEQAEGIYALVSPLNPRFQARAWKTGWDPPVGEIRIAKPPQGSSFCVLSRHKPFLLDHSRPQCFRLVPAGCHIQHRH